MDKSNVILHMTVTKKWNTDNVVSSELSVEDKLLAGLKLTLDSTYAVSSGSKSGVVKAAFKKDHINIGLDANLAKAPLINGSAVVGYQGARNRVVNSWRFWYQFIHIIGLGLLSVCDQIHSVNTLSQPLPNTNICINISSIPQVLFSAIKWHSTLEAAN